MSQKKYCFCFVSQAGRIEIQSILLVLSLIRHLKCPFTLFAGIPSIQPLNNNTLQLFEKLNIVTVQISTPIKGYLTGHKFDVYRKALKSVEADYYVFLDTDMLCQFPFTGLAGMDKHDILVRIAGDTHIAKMGLTWEELYSFFDLPVPEERVTSVRTKNQILPYFNAGLIAVHKNSQFPIIWLEVTKTIIKYFPLTTQLWLDQISLPIAIQKLKMNYHCISGIYNSFPGIDGEAIINHYHCFERLFQTPVSKERISDLYKSNPVLLTIIQNIIKNKRHYKKEHILDLIYLRNFLEIKENLIE